MIGSKVVFFFQRLIRVFLNHETVYCGKWRSKQDFRVLVLISAYAERVGVSCSRDFIFYRNISLLKISLTTFLMKTRPRPKIKLPKLVEIVPDM